VQNLGGCQQNQATSEQHTVCS